jgi:signal transduction histidine kinase
LAEEELVGSLSWLIDLRWLAGPGVLIATWFCSSILSLNLPALPLYLLGAGLLAYNAGLYGTLRWLKRDATRPDADYQWFARLQILLDWIAMTLLIYLSGGIESPALYYFLFHITIASLLLPHDRGFLYVTLAPVLVGGVALLELQGVLPHVNVFDPPRYNDPVYVVGVLFFFTSAAYVMAYLSMTISRRLRRREDELAGLYQSVQAATSSLELTQVLDRLAEATTKALRCKAAGIRLLDETGTHLTMVGSYGLSQAYRDKEPIEVARARIDQEALTGQTVLVLDAVHDERLRYPEKITAEGIGTILSTPLIGKRGPIGVLRAYDIVSHKFSEDDAAFVSAIAAQGVVAIENAQAYQLLEALDQSKSQFIRVVTHELRSPVQVTASLLNVLSGRYSGELNEQQAELVKRAQRRIQFLQKLIDDLLDLAAGKVDTIAAQERAPVSLTEIVKEVVSRFEVSALDKGLTLQSAFPDEQLFVWGDKGELDRITGNLVGNAVKYTQAGEVCVRLDRDKDCARLVIADTGIGIPEAAQSHLFEEFYRAKNAKAMEEAGTGLGLSIVKDLVERYAGTIEVESVENQGTTFTIMLPLANHNSCG